VNVLIAEQKPVTEAFPMDELAHIGAAAEG
jgi:hypothetical protein